MGRMIHDSTTFDILGQLNKRFGPDEIDEMVALQKEFAIFSSQHCLEDSFALLGIEPCEKSERKRWNKFLQLLKTYKSDALNLNGYDRVIKAFEDALKTVTHFPPIPPLPVFVGVHSMAEDDRVTVTEGRPLIFSVQPYVILSIPTKPGRVARQEAADAAKKRRAKKTKK
ncbi:MAG TPA: hypothetical protein VGA15_01555 [Bradyrhizobium sp.]